MVIINYNYNSHAYAVRIDELGFSRQANQMHLVPGQQQLGAQQRSVGCAKDKDVALLHASLRIVWTGGSLSEQEPWKRHFRRFRRVGSDCAG